MIYILYMLMTSMPPADIQKKVVSVSYTMENCETEKLLYYRDHGTMVVDDNIRLWKFELKCVAETIKDQK